MTEIDLDALQAKCRRDWGGMLHYDGADHAEVILTLIARARELEPAAAKWRELEEHGKRLAEWMDSPEGKNAKAQREVFDAGATARLLERIASLEAALSEIRINMGAGTCEHCQQFGWIDDEGVTRHNAIIDAALSGKDGT